MREVRFLAFVVGVGAAMLSGRPAASAQRDPSAYDVARASVTLDSCTDGSVVGSAALIEAPSSEGIKNVTMFRVSLSDGNLGIFDENGASLVIHALPDTYCSNPGDPNCAGGGRIACGIIQRVQ